MDGWTHWTPWPQAGAPDTMVLLALVVVAGAVAGELIALTTRFPRVVGYTLAGWGAALGGVGLSVPMAPMAHLLMDLALALLLFEIGSRVRLRWLHHNPGLLATSVLESAAAAVAVWLALRALGLAPLAAAACAVLAIPASAAVAGSVAQEVGADGQVTQRMTTLTALNTLYGVLALVVLKGWIEAERAPEVAQAAASVGLSFGGALLLAGLLAASVALVARRFNLRQEGPALLVLGLVLLAVSTARWLQVSTLLVPLLAGLLLRNLSPRAWAWPRHFGTAGGLLVLVMFVMVGSAWTPALLLAGLLPALVLLAARGVSKALVVWWLSRGAHASGRQGATLALTLTPLSATALVMLNELHGTDAAFTAGIAPVVLAAVALVELLGPLAVVTGLRAAGEVPDPARPLAESRGRA